MKPATAPVRTRILLADDHAIVRSGFRRLLDRHPGLEVVAEAATAEQTYSAYVEHLPDILVLDISMPGNGGGIEVMQRVLNREPGARVIIFSMHDDASIAERALRLGALGYVSKNSDPNMLVEAVIEVAAGRRFLSPDIAQGVALSMIGGDRNPLTALSGREFDVFRRLVDGESPADIAAALNLSVKTVNNYQTSIKHKLGASSGLELARIALRSDLIK